MEHIAAILTRRTSSQVKDAILHLHPTLDIIPAGPHTRDLIRTMENGSWAKEVPARIYSAFAPIQDDYDLIVWDLPPSETNANYVENVLSVVTGFVVPVKADPCAIKGMRHIAECATVAAQRNPALRFLGVVRFDVDTGSTAVLRELDKLIENALGSKAPIFDGFVRHSIRSALDTRIKGKVAHEYEAEVVAEEKKGFDPQRRLSRTAPNLAADYQHLVTQVLNALEGEDVDELVDVTDDADLVEETTA